MKKFLLLSVFAVLFGCAKNVPEFVPISLNWYSFEGDVREIDSTYERVALDSLQEEVCQISLTRALMNEKAVQSLPDASREFNIQGFGILDSGRVVAVYRGMCRGVSDLFDLEWQPLPLSGHSNCNFIARCDKDGKMESLRVF